MTAVISICPMCGNPTDRPVQLEVCGGCHAAVTAISSVSLQTTSEFPAIGEPLPMPASAPAGPRPVTSPAAGDDEACCTWCQKPRSDVRKLLSHKALHICNECVAFFTEVLAAELGEDWP